MNFDQRTQPSVKRRAGALLSALALSAAVTVSGVSTAKAAECENPDELTFAIIPTEETVAELQLYKPVTDRMAKLTGKKIQFFMPTSYASVVEGLLSKFVDVAVLGPYTYVIANSKDPNVEVFATYAKKKGHMQEEGPGYKAALISKKGSKFTSIESLKGSTLALADPGSTSGNLMPRVVFSKVVNMDIDKFFGKVIYSGSHELSAVAVLKGKVDAAFVATHRFDNVVNKGEAKLEDVNILWESKPIPQDPFVYRKPLCEDIKKNVRETFLGLDKEPGAKKFLANVKSNKFVPMSSEDYDIIRDLKAAKDARKKK
ncbi:MAG: phosphonate ABC transporter substrate-binding protein [Rhodospirillaceae bacterium]|nr:phosphonate ABC transporter substrate-binding protein [Magnetovibrio sp.]MAY68251.1 phosphonate ABC transporter substrate-binding protein [Rhodospirillaceae bacterium]